MADRYTFDPLREAQDSLSGEDGIVSVEGEAAPSWCASPIPAGPQARGRPRRRLPRLAPQGRARIGHAILTVYAKLA